MAALSLILLLGCFAIWRWGGEEVRPPWTDQDGPPSSVGESIKRYLWYLTVGITAGAVSGLIMAGVGGRLAMRILAATASDDVQGRITEANEIVGEITLGGSLGFIFFTGLLVGFPSGVGFLLLRRWLPRGLIGGLTFGALLLVLFSTRLDPLRQDNVDFDLVGPGWLAVAIFVAMGLGHGMLLAAFAGRFSRTLPLISKDRKAVSRYLPLVILLPAPPVAVLAILVGGVYAAASRVRALRGLTQGRNLVVGGRILVGLAMLVALPDFISGVIDIAGRP